MADPHTPRAPSAPSTHPIHAQTTSPEKMKAHSRRRTLSTVIRNLKARHGMGDPDEALARVKKQVTHGNMLLDIGADQHLGARRESGQSDHSRDMENQFNLEQIMSSLQPPSNQGRRLDQICRQYGLSRYPNISTDLQDTRIQTLKPHQVVDAAEIVRRGRSPLRHCILASGTGTGKTKTYLMALWMLNRKMQKRHAEHYRASLILTPVASMEQAFSEISTHFPDLVVIVFYTDSNPGAKIFGDAKVLGTEGLERELGRLARESKDPKTGRTVILSTYYTWSNRLVKKKEMPFKWTPQAARSGARSTAYLSPREVDMDQVILLEPTQRDEKEGVIISYEWKAEVSDNIREYEFQYLVADDAHCCRKLQGGFHNMLSLVEFVQLLWVTATPIVSSPRELLSPLHLMWDKYDTEETRMQGDLSQLCKTAYRKNFLDEHQEEVYDKYRVRPWILSPELYRAYGEPDKWRQKTGKVAARSILKEVQIHRTMLTKMELPDGSVTSPGGDIPPAIVAVEELEHGPDQAREIKKLGIKAAKEAFPHLGALEEAPGDGGRLRQDVHREAALKTFDHRLCKLLKEEGRVHMKGSDEPTEPVLGIKHLKQLTSDGTGKPDLEGGLGGLEYYCMKTGIKKKMEGVDDVAKIEWLAAKSPVMIRLLDLAAKYVGNQERFAVFVDDVWMQYILCRMFNLADFKVTTMYSSHKSHERKAMIRDWNDDSSGMQILVGNMKLLGTGVDLHGCCSKGAIIGWGLSPTSMHQTIGRLVRLGQREAVRFHLIKVKNSYHDNMERLLVRKWALQQSTKIRLPSWLRGALREVCVYEMIKTAWNQPFSRYVWVVLEDHNRSGTRYESKHIEMVAHAMSIAAKLLLRCRDSAEQDMWERFEYVLYLGCIEVLRGLQKDRVGQHARVDEYLALDFEELHKEFIPRFKAASKRAKGERWDGKGRKWVVEGLKKRLGEMGHSDAEVDETHESDSEGVWSDGSDGGDRKEQPDRKEPPRDGSRHDASRVKPPREKRRAVQTISETARMDSWPVFRVNKKPKRPTEDWCV